MQCDEYLEKQIEDLKKQLHDQQIEHNKKIEELQREMVELEKKCIVDKYELKSIVKDGTLEAIEKFETKQDEKLKPIREDITLLKKDVKALQNEKFEKWKFALKTAGVAAITTTVGWVINSLVTNFLFIK